MTARSLSPSAAYAESLGNYLSTYLCPVAPEKPFHQKVFQTDKYPTGVHFEELRVFKRAPSTTTSGTTTHRENHSSANDDGAVPYAPYGVSMYRKGAVSPGVNTISYQSERHCATSEAGHDFPQVTQNVNISWKNLGKPVSQSAVYWKTSLTSQSYEPQEENVILPGHSGQYQLETDNEGGLEVFTKLNGNQYQDRQDGGRHDGETRGSDHQSISASPAMRRLYDTSYDLFEPSDYEYEITKERKLPNISTFRRFVNSYESDSVSRESPTEHSDVTPQQIQTKGSQTRDQWSMLSKEQFHRNDVTTQKPKNTPRENSYYRDHTTTAEENSQITDQCCDNDVTSNLVNASESEHTAFQDHRKQKYRCSVCWKSFSQTANLKAHVRIHTGEKPFECQVCDRRFSQRSSVKTHMRIHSGERPFSCTFCKKSFYDSSTLIKHRRIHTGEKPYLCKICHQRFSQSGNLTRHYKLHMTKKM